MPNGPTILKPGELPKGAKRDPGTGKIYYPGGLGSTGKTSLSDVFGKTKELFGRIETEGVTGPGGKTLMEPTGTSPLQKAVTGEEPAAGADDLTKRLTTAMTGAEGATSLREEKKTLEEERGVGEMREIVGSFEEEISKTQSLLDELEEDISERTREYLVSDPQRRRILAAERAPITKEFGALTRGLGVTEARLERTEADILTELGLIEKEKTEPLELLEREVDIRSKIKDLTDKDIPDVVSSTFNEEGDMTIVTQDPDTGAFKTQTIKGIGEKATQYQSITSQVDDQGNLTIIGTSRDGEATVLGTFKGVGRTAQAVTVDGAVTVGGALGLDPSTARAFDADLEQAYKDLFSGKYGYEGAREKALNFLTAKYPGKKEGIAEHIYGNPEKKIDPIFPDGYEEGIALDEQVKFSDSQINEIVEAYLSEREDTDTEEKLDALTEDEVRELIGTGVINVNEEEIKLTPSQKIKFLEAIDKREGGAGGGIMGWVKSLNLKAPFSK